MAAAARRGAPQWCAIEGRVVDEHQRPVPDAHVELTIAGTRPVAVDTDSQGQYLIALAQKWDAHAAQLSANAGTDGVGSSSFTLHAGRNAPPDIELRRREVAAVPRPGQTGSIVQRTLFYATDRVAEGGGFGGQQDTRIHFGTFTGTAQIGRGDCAPFTSWRCATTGSAPAPDDFIHASSPQPVGCDCADEERVFLAQVEHATRGRPAPRILVFVHGFNQSFGQAQSAMVRFVLSSGWGAGAPILYSWPSQGSVKRYLADSETVAAPQTLAAFEHLLTALLRLPTHPQLYLAAHSMGNRLLIGALRDLPQLKGHVAAIAYLAADVREADFRFSARALESVATRQKVYASHNDIALRISDCHNDSRRLGEGPTSLDPGIAVFDATEVATPQEWGHSYFGNTLPVAQDLNAFVGGRPDAGIAQALGRLKWLGVRASPALNVNEIAFESAFACSVVQALGY